MLLFTLFVGFAVGVLTIIAVEGVLVVLVIGRLSRRAKEEEEKSASKSARAVSDLHHSFDSSSYCNKQGVVWVLDPGKVPKSWPVDKLQREQKRTRDIFEVAPIRKYAKVRDHSLILTELDGSHSHIQLKDCTIATVSATALTSRKWAKRYPIKVESGTSIIYNGSKTVYIYLETSWEKESWCKALRLASCNDKQKLKWFSKLNKEFQDYLMTLNTGYPTFMKPSASCNSELIDRSIKPDGSSSKVRHFLKKFAKKASKSGVENKMSGTQTPDREEKKISEKCHSFQDSILGTGVGKIASVGNAPGISADNKNVESSSTLSDSGRRSHVSFLSDADCDDKIGSDEGTLCWNLLISRLFFDAKSNTEMKKFLQARIQKTLSNMRTTSYIGELNCTGVDIGNLPPYINGMRVLPSDMNEVWALEIDIQYLGGAALDIETRLEVRELDLEKGMVDSSSMEDVTEDLLEDIECFGKQLEQIDVTERKDEADSKLDGKRDVTTNRGSSSRWKTILKSVAKQVSQVPISLAITVASLKGTMRLHIKPPPSDQLWYGFTSMPDIEFKLESSVGEHKIKSGRIAPFLINRLKASIQGTLVLPNCESLCIPWMLAEKDDWVPRNVAPFLWVNREFVNDSTSVRQTPCSQPGEATLPITDASREMTCDLPGIKRDKGKNTGCHQQQISESSSAHASSSDSANKSTWSSSKSRQDLTTPLLSNVEQTTSEGNNHEDPECQSPSRSFAMSREQIQVMEDGDVGPKRMGTRARMLGLGKKMGEKIEEKRRNIEEKGRNIVDKMRGP